MDDARARREATTDVRQTMAQQVGNRSKHFFAVFSSTLAALGSLLIVTFVAIYIAVDPAPIGEGSCTSCRTAAAPRPSR